MTDHTQNNRPLKLTVIMVDGSFRERFHSIASFANQTLAPDEYEIIWVEYFSDIHPQLRKALQPHPHARAHTLGRTGEYHSSFCFNYGIEHARGQLIVIPDADVIVEPTFLENVLADHQANDQLVEYFYRYNEPQHAHKPEIDLKHLQDVCILSNPSNHGACLSVRKHWLLAINGYEQHPYFATGFHANDLDIYTRLKAMGLFVRWSPTEKLYHPWHAMTGEYSDNYLAQQRIIIHRAMHVLTRPFQGIDPSLDTELPASLAKAIEWQRIQRMPLPQRVLHKLGRRLQRAA